MTNRESREILSRLAVYVALMGWVLLGLYVLFIYFEYTDFSRLAEDFLSSSYVGFKVRSLIFFAPLISMSLGYAINERAKFLRRLVKTEKKLEYSYNDISNLLEGLIFSFARALDAKSKWTKGHSERVTLYSLMIAREMGLGEQEVETLKTAALLHDIGKIGTADEILNKPGKLTVEEMRQVMLHPAEGEEILKSIKQYEEIRLIIRHHHEHFDGFGYPDKIQGDEIPLLSRIICVADSFDAMTADRPYRSAPGRDFAISQLKKCSYKQFDYEVVKAFLSAYERQEKIESRLYPLNMPASVSLGAAINP